MTRPVLLATLALLTGLSLTGCGQPCADNDTACWKQLEAQSKEACKPYKIAVSPDGVILWKVDSRCDEVYSSVYFSSRGTQYDVSHGKTHETVTVPNAD